MATRLSGTDALSLHTESAKTPAHTLTLVIIDASDQLSHTATSTGRRVAAATGAIPQPTGGQAAGCGAAPVGRD